VKLALATMPFFPVWLHVLDVAMEYVRLWEILPELLSETVTESVSVSERCLEMVSEVEIVVEAETENSAVRLRVELAEVDIVPSSVHERVTDFPVRDGDAENAYVCVVL